jgi:Rps23 Pro-64 3,4-dihydroxylase Tpa1-like proline 4-hydroxylase
MNNFIGNKIIKSLANLQIETSPYDHAIIDNFLSEDFAKSLSNEFPDFNDDIWFNYKNKIEDKKLLSDWRKFPTNTYQLFSFLNSPVVLELLSNIFGTKLYPDHGLHGGGWHIHANGGKLNPHLDYSMHPHLELQRKLNLIIYLCEDWNDSYGGHFGLWNSDSSVLEKEISVGFNKAVLFDTTQNSWHGLSRQVNCPENKYRKSLAIYYLCEPPKDVDKRSRALFAPTEDQKNDESVLDLIKKRSDYNTSKSVYIN